MCAVIATELGFEGDRLSRMRLAGLLHDVGKIGVPDAILNKPSRLTDVEYEVMKRHSPLGFDIVQAADMPLEADWVRHHHERFDGGGYLTVRRRRRPLESRIILAADAFKEATTSDRPYRRRLARTSRCRAASPRRLAVRPGRLETLCACSTASARKSAPRSRPSLRRAPATRARAAQQNEHLVPAGLQADGDHAALLEVHPPAREVVHELRERRIVADDEHRPASCSSSSSRASSESKPLESYCVAHLRRDVERLARERRGVQGADLRLV